VRLDTLIHCRKPVDNFPCSRKSEKMEEEHTSKGSPGYTKIFSRLCYAPVVVYLPKTALEKTKKEIEK